MSILAAKSFWAFASFVLCVAAERLWPYVQRSSWFAHAARNLSLAFMNFLLGPLIVLPVTAFAAAHGLGLRPSWWGWPLDLLALDLWIYFWHRANHELPFLWRFHEIHHLDQELDVTSGIRFHFGEVVLSALVRSAFVWLLAIPLANVAVFETLVLAAAFFQHSNVRLPDALEIALSKLVITPRLHWVHHHAKRADTDSNYATILSAWDVLFGSRSPTERDPAMAIGVEGLADRPLPKLFMRPFEPRD